MQKTYGEQQFSLNFSEINRKYQSIRFIEKVHIQFNHNLAENITIKESGTAPSNGSTMDPTIPEIAGTSNSSSEPSLIRLEPLNRMNPYTHVRKRSWGPVQIEGGMKNSFTDIFGIIFLSKSKQVVPICKLDQVELTTPQQANRCPQQAAWMNIGSGLVLPTISSQ